MKIDLEELGEKLVMLGGVLATPILFLVVDLKSKGIKWTDDVFEVRFLNWTVIFVLLYMVCVSLFNFFVQKGEFERFGSLVIASAIILGFIFIGM